MMAVCPCEQESCLLLETNVNGRSNWLLSAGGLPHVSWLPHVTDNTTR
jgi:hypothetical protein